MSNNDYRAIFEKHNIKYTKQRALIFTILNAAKLPLTIESIYLEYIKAGQDISLSTVYRVIDTFVENKIAIISGYDGKKTLYELNRDEHKHLLICLKCNQIVTLEHCPLEDYEDAVRKSTNFDITDHQLSLYGYCFSCRTPE